MDKIIDFLSEATEQQMTPVKGLIPSSYLYVKLTENGEDFLVEFKSLKELSDFDAESARSLNIPVSIVGGRQFTSTGYAPPADVLGWFRRLPERTPILKKGQRKSQATKYKVTTTDFNALMIAFCWPKDKVIFTKMAKEAFDFLLRRLEMQQKRAREHAEFKVNKTLPEIHPLLLKIEARADKDVKLSPYQLFAAHLSFLQEGLGLFMDTGTGKTPTVIRRMNAESVLHKKGHLGDKPRMMRVLVVCPRQVRLNWVLEIEKFTVVPGKVMALRGSQPKRLRQLIENVRDEKDCYFSVTIVSYDTVVSDVDILTRCKWDLLVTDESHRFKSAKTARWKALREVASCSSRKQALTGTPICNGYVDLWTQLEFLGEGQSGFKRREAFKRFFGKYAKVGAKTDKGQEIEKLIGMDNVPLLKERMTRMTFSISKKEADLQLPDKMYDTWEVEMTPRQTELYESLRDELAVQHESLAGEMNSMSANHVLTQLLRLAQITSGFAVWDKEFSSDGLMIRDKRIEQIDPGNNPKIKLVLDMLENDTDSNEKVLIWAINREDIRALDAAINEAGFLALTYYGSTSEADREANENAFNNDPNVKVMILNPQSASEGLNLLGYNYRNPKEDWNSTDIGLEVFFSQNWSAFQRKQAEDRGHRRGTRRSVRIRDLSVPGTIDEDIRKRVLSKLKTANELQDISNLLRSVLGMTPTEV